MLMAVLASGCGKPATPPDEVQPAANTHYVAVAGSDGQTGTREAPLKSINRALAIAKPGDTIFVRGGIYHEKVVFPKSGQLDRYVTLKAHPGEQPIIDGTGLSISGKDALVTVSNVSFIQVEGFEIRNYRSTTPWVDVNGIIVNGTSAHIRIIGNHIHHIENNAAPEAGRSGHAIEVLGSATSAITDVLIEGNEIHDCNTGYSENLTINGYVDGFVVRRNKVYNGENIGIVAAGGYAGNPDPARNYARNGLITENEVYAIDGTTGPIPAYAENRGAIGIYVDGAQGIIVERNHVHHNDRGIGIVSETDNFPTRDCIVRNNVVNDCFLTGIYLGGYIGYTGGGTRHCYVVNNTLVRNNRETGYYDEIEGEIRLTENCFDNVIANNLVYARGGSVYVHKYSGSGSGNTFDHNSYYSDGGSASWIWAGAGLATFADWQSASQADAASASGVDPLLLDIANGDFRVSPSSSPVIGAGTVLDAEVLGSVDFAGNPRIVSGLVDQGAFQHRPR